METRALQLHLHYYFDDKGRHSIDAFIRNENEKDFLLVLKKTFEVFDTQDAIIEIIPSAEGGLLDRYKILVKKNLKYGSFILLAFTAYWTYLGNKSIIQVNEIDLQLKKIELRKKLKELEQDSISKSKSTALTKDIVSLAVDTLSTDYKSRLHRSQFYGRSYKVTPVITQISTQPLETEQPLEKEKIVRRANFNEFILKSGSIAAMVDDEAVITIIAPVITGGKYKWRGWYKNEEIQFTMADLKFRQDIQLGKVEFTGGSTIECVLQINRKIDENTGEIRNAGKTVLRVNAHILNNKRTEFTHKKKLKHEVIPKLNTSQLDFFGSKG